MVGHVLWLRLVAADCSVGASDVARKVWAGGGVDGIGAGEGSHNDWSLSSARMIVLARLRPGIG
jgi:hypothetical protein